MSPFPQAIAEAQRRALHAELGAAEEALAQAAKNLHELEPHLVAMTRKDYDEVWQLISAASAALRRAEVLTK